MALGLSVALTAVVSTGQAPASGPVRFTPHDIAAGFRGGYAVSVADFNKDGKPDVIANSLALSELAWYENPSWTRHVIVADTRQIVHQAMGDIDSDGVPEIAILSGFAMQAANSQGLTWIARHQADPRQPWKVERIDAYPTSHRVTWADLDGDGRTELVNAPLIGPKSLGPTFDQDRAPVFWYRPSDWTRQLVTDSVPGIIHGIRTVKWDPGPREQLLVASFEGIALYRSTGSGSSLTFQRQLLSPGHVEKAPRLGASDAEAGMQAGTRFFASIEPWHGNEVVVYADRGGTWTRRVLFDKVGSGHTIAVADLNADGRDDVIANDNSRPTPNNPSAPAGGVHVFYAPDNAATGEWTYQKIDDTAMNCCVSADLNGDTRLDLVCTGNGAFIRWYENLGK